MPTTVQKGSPLRIAVLADTHDRLPPRLPDLLSCADEIWHLGDVCSTAILDTLRLLTPHLRWIRGNCDPFPDWPESLDLDLFNLRIRLIHAPPRRATGCDLLLHGHTHVPRDEVLLGTRFLNPGCITRPNQGAPRSFAWLDLSGEKPPVWSLVRLD
jgi:putative phosphoesterase